MSEIPNLPIPEIPEDRAVSQSTSNPSVQTNQQKLKKKMNRAAVMIICLIFAQIGGYVYWYQSDLNRSIIYDVAIPADIYEASTTCLDKMKDRFDQRLLRYYMDERSSRAELDKFRVFYIADIGELSDYKEFTIYCYIEKGEMDLSYFREYGKNVEGLQSKSVRFFQNRMFLGGRR